MNSRGPLASCLHGKEGMALAGIRRLTQMKAKMKISRGRMSFLADTDIARLANEVWQWFQGVLPDPAEEALRSSITTLSLRA
jgi:hypothetical protein